MSSCPQTKYKTKDTLTMIKLLRYPPPPPFSIIKKIKVNISQAYFESASSCGPITIPTVYPVSPWRRLAVNPASNTVPIRGGFDGGRVRLRLLSGCPVLSRPRGTTSISPWVSNFRVYSVFRFDLCGFILASAMLVTFGRHSILCDSCQLRWVEVYKGSLLLLVCQPLCVLPAQCKII